MTRIALCGSAGTGKTTLGRALADALGLPFLEEGMRTRIEAGLRPASLSSLELERLFAELWEEQRTGQERAVERDGGYVADRSAVDFAAAWLQYTDLHDPARTETWISDRLQDAQRLHDRVVVLPWGSLPLASDGVRSTDGWFQFRFQCMVEGFARRSLPPEQVLWVPAEPSDLEARTRWVLAATT